MQLNFLGTGSAHPSPNRGASCIVLRTTSGSCWMFDCGEGTQTQLMKSDIRPRRLEKIFITHLHGDHLFGLPGLLCTISMNSGGQEQSRAPIQIYGPRGLGQYLRTCLKLSDSCLNFAWTVHELCLPDAADNKELDQLLPATVDIEQSTYIYPNKNKTWDILEEGNLSVSAGFLKHRIPCFGYVIQEASSPGKLNAALLQSKGIPPGPLYARIKNGESITCADGTIIQPKDVLSPPYPGRKVVILGDTCDSEGIADIAKNADVLVHEATNENAHEEKCVENGHSTPAMAAHFARKIAAKKLILTHFSQRYKAVNEDLKPGEENVSKLVKEAEEIFGENVVGAEDFLVMNIGK